MTIDQHAFSTSIRSVVVQNCQFIGAVLATSMMLTAVWMQSAQAQNLVTNGNFSQVLVQSSAEFGTANNGFTPTQTITGWTTAGYNFVFLPNTADKSGATGQYNTTATTSSPGLKLWGLNDGGTTAVNGIGSIASSPSGGNYIAADGAYEVSPITQTIAGLTSGATYSLSFSWAGAQQYGASYTNSTTEQWIVSLGSSTQSTTVQAVPGEGFSGWMTQTFNFVATSSSEALSFLAAGTPGGQPPFALLANVSMTKVPEPGSATLMISAVLGLIGLARRRSKPDQAANAGW